MPTYRIFHLKPHLRQQFRFAPHVSGAARVKPRDYESAGTVEATSPYAAYFALRSAGTPIDVGDVLDAEGALTIFKYVGFEEAHWFVPEPVAAAVSGADEALAGVHGQG